jgi:PPM family protein phosphatase
VTEVGSSTASLLRSAFRTDAGRVRTNNEDVPLVDTDRGVYAVIDGVGGQAAGEIAAAVAREVILQRLGRPLGTPAERVREAIALANNEIVRRAESSPALRGMTCVVTLAVVSDGMVTVGHVGDSRLYKLGPSGMRKLTHDHSPVGEREDAGEVSEREAMRHPRRNEVFRDVGGTYRDKDEDDYVEVIEEPLGRDCAILLCTDGLTDMVPSGTVDRLVRRHAGSPQAVVDALVAAANDAGGKDNVTVVYAEAPGFERAVRATSARSRGGSARRSIARSRTTWFAVGALAGVLGALLLVWRAAGGAPAGRTLDVVEGGGTSTFARIGDAMSAARPGDVVRLSPGTYREQVLVSPGVSVVARVPGSVTLARDGGAEGEWVALAASGNLSGRIAGIRIESTPELPVDVGLRVAGESHTIELVELAGPMRAGIELLPGAAATVQGSHFAVDGPAVTLPEQSFAELTANVFLRADRAAGAPIAMADSAQTTLRRNVFAGFGVDIVVGPSAADRQQLLTGNVVIPGEPSLVR